MNKLDASVSDRQFISLYSRALGDVIRRHRKGKVWTRKELQEQLPGTARDVSLQTLATYELGTRRMTADRLDEIAQALGTRASQLLAEVEQRMYGPATYPVGPVTVDLRVLAHAPQPALAPARRWAMVQLDVIGEFGNPVVSLTPDAVSMLAELCHVDTPELEASFLRSHPRR
ncbi:MAG TPA: helix-turn-helix transcriptional regulator [Pseudonocardiaceae bacterium]|jgi:hypothetical protein|nr:helix-turn-helix transcriptional regulator [Pseudonocardiaceae bacterium]